MTLKDLRKIEDPVKKRALFVALLAQEVAQRGGRSPIVVGGEALEIYTQGGYTTGDIDIKGPASIINEVLLEWGFSKKGRVWFHEELDVYVGWLGEALDEGSEAEKRVTTVVVGDGLEVKVISVEDLIIDRLSAVKWWKDEDGIMWAKVLVEVKKAAEGHVDRDYLLERAASAGVRDLLEEVLR